MSEKLYTPEMAKALSAFQENCPKIELDGEVAFKGVKFKYATLSNIVDKIRPALKKAGLSFTQRIERVDEAQCLVTDIICVADGSSFRSTMPMQFGNDPKTIGGNITYFKRYNLCAALGIVAEDDKDHETTGSNERPVLTEKNYKEAVDRIIKGETGLLEKLLSTYVLDAGQIRKLVHAEDIAEESKGESNE